MNVRLFFGGEGDSFRRSVYRGHLTAFVQGNPRSGGLGGMPAPESGFFGAMMMLLSLDPFSWGTALLCGSAGIYLLYAWKLGDG